jgi:putative transposase
VNQAAIALPAHRIMLNPPSVRDLTGVSQARTEGKDGGSSSCALQRLVTFYQFPKAHWKHLRTTNPIESPFAAVRLRTTAAKRFKRVENATAVIWKTLLVAEQTFRRLDAPELLAEVAEGVTYVNGVRVKSSQPTAEAKAAA